MTVQEVIEKFKLCKTTRIFIPKNEALDIAIGCMEEVEQYRALGTVEELKEAREKQVAKKPIIKGEEIGFSVHCPNCDSYVGYLTEGMNEPEQMEYCNVCGQHIANDWEEGGTSD